MPITTPEPEVQQPYLQVIGGFLTEHLVNLRLSANGVVNVAKGGKEWVDGLSPGTKAVAVGVTGATVILAAPAAVGYTFGVTALGPITGGGCATLQSWGLSTAVIQSTAMSTVSTSMVAGSGLLSSAAGYLGFRTEKPFKPDLSNNEQRIAGVSERMSAEAQGLITRFEAKMATENDPAIQLYLKNQRSTLEEVKHAKTDDISRKNRFSSGFSSNPFYTDDPIDDESRAWEALKAADAYLKTLV
ncbi:hypothetical protein TrST_g7556 [Triparma strigata]|uniref:Uncharacterized protein n=1 Tax=Triparma strigata TaxID=1606541 RepID=A0A9W7ATS2_9STRA|nr:hypothetical protein TrST_g7556 [Triparma strigata]